jgi:hypothetical protein
MKLNRAVAWSSMAAGAVTGLLLGLWSFAGPLPVPGFLGEYGSTARRLARLGHIACFGLGFINLLLAAELPRLGRGARTAAVAMNVGNVAMPLVLFAAAVHQPVKYLLPVPALSVTLALALAAYGAFHGQASQTPRGRLESVGPRHVGRRAG